MVRVKEYMLRVADQFTRQRAQATLNLVLPALSVIEFSVAFIFGWSFAFGVYYLFFFCSNYNNYFDSEGNEFS